MKRALLGFVFVATAAAAATLRSVTPQEIDAIFAPWNKAGSPGVALAVLHEGRTLYERGYGRANLEHDIPITPETIFYIGSVSKQFTAAAISLLAKDGKVNLDDDIRRYVPEIPDYGSVITLRQLIHHTSGLRDYLALRGLAGEAADGVFDDAHVLELLSRQKSLNFPPGSEHLYSNSGYFLLSVVIKRVSGKSLRNFAAERIFAPLGMTSAQFRDDHALVIPHRADGYAPGAAGKFRLSNPNFDVVGAGGVFMSVRDFAQWDENFYQPRIGDREWVRELETPGKLNSGEKLTYAFGLVEVRSRGALRIIEHNGAYGGFRAHAMRVPEHHLSIVCFTNLATMTPSQLSRRVLALYLGNQAAATATSTTPVRTAGDDDAAERKAGASKANTNALTPAEITAFSGDYYSEELQVMFRVRSNGGNLTLQRVAGLPQSLIVAGPKTFRSGPLRLVFEQNAEMPAASFALDSGRVRGLVFTRK